MNSILDFSLTISKQLFTLIRRRVLFMNLLPSPPRNAKWSQHGTTVFRSPEQNGTHSADCTRRALYIDDDLTAFIVELENNHALAWKKDALKGEVVAGGHGSGNRLDQLNRPSDILVDKETNSLLICDLGNKRVIRWPRQSGTTSGEIVLDNVDGVRIVMDDQKNLYISDPGKNEVRRYSAGDTKGEVVAGGNGKGNRLDQLDYPIYLFVDHEYSLYVSDSRNDRVMKWPKGAKEGIVVAGGQDKGNLLTQLGDPRGLWIDEFKTVYVVESLNNRVTRWLEGEKRGTIIVGGHGQGEDSNQFLEPVGLFFDRLGNLYVVDTGNSRIQRFSIETS